MHKLWANKAHALDAAIPLSLHFGGHRRRASDVQRLGMRIGISIISLLTLICGGCAYYGAIGASPIPTPYGITRASGTEQAHRDLAAGKVRLLEAGTIGVCTPGVEPTDTRFAQVPRHTLPVGCNTPNAHSWVEYAEGYNAVVIARLEKELPR
jgi:hypothetical protein